MSDAGLRVGVLASGAGTNLQAILDTVHGRDGIEIVAVASDDAGRAGARARRGGGRRERRLRALEASRTAPRATPRWPTWLAERGVGLVVLAGYMQLLTPGLPAALPRRG